MNIVCWVCKEPITGARNVIDGFWYCGPCTYKHDYPDKVVKKPVKPPVLKKQKETLFVPPPKARKT